MNRGWSLEGQRHPAALASRPQMGCDSDHHSTAGGSPYQYDLYSIGYIDKSKGHCRVNLPVSRGGSNHASHAWTKSIGRPQG